MNLSLHNHRHCSALRYPPPYTDSTHHHDFIPNSNLFSRQKLQLSYVHCILNFQVKSMLYFLFIIHRFWSPRCFCCYLPEPPTVNYPLTIIRKFPNFPKHSQNMLPKLSRTGKMHLSFSKHSPTDPVWNIVTSCQNTKVTTPEAVADTQTYQSSFFSLRPVLSASRWQPRGKKDNCVHFHAASKQSYIPE